MMVKPGVAPSQYNVDGLWELMTLGLSIFSTRGLRTSVSSRLQRFFTIGLTAHDRHPRLLVVRSKMLSVALGIVRLPIIHCTLGGRAVKIPGVTLIQKSFEKRGML